MLGDWTPRETGVLPFSLLRMGERLPASLTEDRRRGVRSAAESAESARGSGRDRARIRLRGLLNVHHRGSRRGAGKEHQDDPEYSHNDSNNYQDVANPSVAVLRAVSRKRVSHRADGRRITTADGDYDS